jgi:hypothetical protein
MTQPQPSDNDDVLRALEQLSASAEDTPAAPPPRQAAPAKPPAAPPRGVGASPPPASAQPPAKNAPAVRPAPPASSGQTGEKPSLKTPPLAPPTPPVIPDKNPEPLKLGPPTPKTRHEPLTDASAVQTDRAATDYRCLNCGYPLPQGDELRCTECGRTYAASDLEYWFAGDEARRFDIVIWLALANLFLRLMVLPNLQWIARAGGGLLIAFSCWAAAREKLDGPGRYYGIAGAICGLLMFIGFSGDTSRLPYYTLDIIGACALLLSMLHTPDNLRIGRHTMGGQLAPFVLFAAPVLGIALYMLDQVGPVPNLPAAIIEHFPFYTALAPAVFAAGVWILVWRTLAGLKRLYFTPRDAL